VRFARVSAEPLDLGMDFLALLGALLETSSLSAGGRVTVKDRYEMKKRVRKLKEQEKLAKRREK
jgi:hypothetical protein